MMDDRGRTNDRGHKMTRATATSDSDSGDDGRGRRPMRRSLSESGSSPMCAACGHEHAPGTTCETCGHHRRPATATRDPGGLRGGESTSKDSGNGGPPVRSGPTRCEPIVEVIDKFLCIGAFEHTSRDEALLACGIRTVMNTVPTCSPCCSNRNINVFTAPADAKDPTKIDLVKTTQKLEVLHGVANRADQAGMPNRVLVYCMSGQSRAPSVAVAYLMRSERRRLDDAMSALARRYPRGHRGITLKPGDYEHLEAFERELFPDG